MQSRQIAQDMNHQAIELPHLLLALVQQPGKLSVDGYPKSVARANHACLTGQFFTKFLNCIDEIIIFHKLEKEQLGKIVSIQLKRVEKLLLNADTFWKFRLPRVEYLTEVSYDADFGTRPLKRAIQHELQDPLAIKLLNGDFHPGDTIQVEPGTDGLTFRAK